MGGGNNLAFFSFLNKGMTRTPNGGRTMDNEEILPWRRARPHPRMNDPRVEVSALCLLSEDDQYTSNQNGKISQDQKSTDPCKLLKKNLGFVHPAGGRDTSALPDSTALLTLPGLPERRV